MDLNILLAEIRAFRGEINARLDSQDDAIRQLELAHAERRGEITGRGRVHEGIRWLVMLIVSGAAGLFGAHIAPHQ